MSEPAGDPLGAVRAAVVRLGRRVVGAGLVVASGGNVAARLPGGDDIVVTPSAWPLDELRPDLLPVVGPDGAVRVPPVDGARPTSELAVHLAVLAARPDATVVVHLHPPMATLLASLGTAIRTITTDHALALRRTATVPYHHPGSDELAHAVGTAARDHDVVLLAHHGCVVVADDPDVALTRAANLEAAAVATHHARQLGDHDTACPPEFLAHVDRIAARGVRYGRRAT